VEQRQVDYSAEEVSRAIRRLDMALSEMHSEMATGLSMGTAELMALAHLAMDGPLGPGELALRLHLTTGAVTALLDRLAERGHIVREAHRADRRRVVVRLTTQARADALKQLRPMTFEILALTTQLTADDRQTVGRFLDALATIVGRYTGQGQGDRSPVPGDE
jgi:DNA-binding MarR family transcriptional regulator